MSFKKIEPNQTLPELEEETLKYWQENSIFEKSLDQRKDSPSFSFYDGPPFASGSPHYGHIVGSTMKDVVPRYWTMKGFYVPRVWGWDCHGLPIENIAESSLGIKNKKEIEELGVEKFNDTCRTKVLTFVKEWEEFIPRLGRWVDMKNAYKTMDLPYMESVWWVFKNLYDQGLIYEGYRSMYICPRCETTLSQSEVAEGYRDIKDLSVIAKFALQDEKNTFLLAWTTTPWTLIANVALAVNPKVIYCNVKCQMTNDKKDEIYIVAKDRIKEIFKDTKYEIIEEFNGEKLIGEKYQPLFDYYQKDINPPAGGNENGWQVVAADFVSTEEGTGIVHIAPGFGEDDLKLAKEKNLPFIQHIGMDGVIKKEAGDFAGLHVKPTDDTQKTDVEIIKYLANKNLLFLKEQYLHSYPHCWRCDTPLLNYATSSYFVSVEKLKNEAIRLSEKINWTPKHVKAGRFGKWLEGARDWSISRQRFWASVIPIWKCSAEHGGCGETKVIGSIKELEDLSGQKITDIHKDKIDKVTFKCEKCSKDMKRIPDVLDTWFDSGSMPYAQNYYPFENKEKFDKTFPADFIGEGQDQTRCWFYYLHLISTAIKKEIAFKNVVVNGIVLAEDGKKMSKRLKNYPDPKEVIDKYGADALRLYLLTSKVLQMENLNFSENDLSDMTRGTLRMLYNSYSFFVMYANIDGWKWEDKETERQKVSENILDKWIISELNKLIKNINNHMDDFELTKASRAFILFIDNLSNWYVRRSRKRFQKAGGADKNNAYKTLYEVLTTLSKLMAPFTPFLADEIYRNLTKKTSVHLEEFPKENPDLINEETNQKMIICREIVEKGLSKRAELGKTYKVRQPLGYLSYAGEKIDEEFEEIIKQEVNVKEIKYDKNNKEIEIDKNITEDLKKEGIKNDIMRSVQDLRKNAGYSPDDKVSLFVDTSANIKNIIENYKNDIKQETNLSDIKYEKIDTDKEIDINIANENIWLGVKK
jgi:isoleucyl-tRNA synthetase